MTGKPVGEQAQRARIFAEELRKWADVLEEHRGNANPLLAILRNHATLTEQEVSGHGGEQAREPERMAVLCELIEKHALKFFSARTPDPNNPLVMVEPEEVKKVAIAYAAHCREAEQRELADEGCPCELDGCGGCSDGIERLRHRLSVALGLFDRAEASLRSAKADAYQQGAKWLEEKLSSSAAQAFLKDVSVPSAPTAKEE